MTYKPSSTGEVETTIGTAGNPVSSITDEEAELELPKYTKAFERYHKLRLEGCSPALALQETWVEWRELFRDMAYVPHRS